MPWRVSGNHVSNFFYHNIHRCESNLPVQSSLPNYGHAAIDHIITILVANFEVMMQAIVYFEHALKLVVLFHTEVRRYI